MRAHARTTLRDRRAMQHRWLASTVHSMSSIRSCSCVWCLLLAGCIANVQSYPPRDRPPPAHMMCRSRNYRASACYQEATMRLRRRWRATRDQRVRKQSNRIENNTTRTESAMYTPDLGITIEVARRLAPPFAAAAGLKGTLPQRDGNRRRTEHSAAHAIFAIKPADRVKDNTPAAIKPLALVIHRGSACVCSRASGRKSPGKLSLIIVNVYYSMRGPRVERRKA